MKEKSSIREEAKTREQQFEQVADKTLENYEQTLRMGLKLQEEAARWWGNVLTQGSSGPDWQRRFNGLNNIASEVMPLAQDRFEEVVDLMEKNNRASAELVRKAVDAVQTASMAEMQSKWLEVWTSSLGAVRSNVESISEINTRALDSCIDFMRRNTEVTEVRTPKAAAGA